MTREDIADTLKEAVQRWLSTRTRLAEQMEVFLPLHRLEKSTGRDAAIHDNAAVIPFLAAIPKGDNAVRGVLRVNLKRGKVLRVTGRQES